MLTPSLNTKDKDMTGAFNFNANWLFSIIDEEDLTERQVPLTPVDPQDPAWEKVTVPHTSRIEPSLVNDMWRGTCRYHKTFALDETFRDKTIIIQFEGVMTVADVWVNGVEMTTRLGGYLPFSIDISEVAKIGEDNVIDVIADNRDHPGIPPGKPHKELDFCWYGGIYRNVKLVVKDRLRITDHYLENKVASGGVRVSYPIVGHDRAIVQIQTHVRNDHPSEKRYSIQNTVVDEQGEIVASDETAATTLAPNSDETVTSSIELTNPSLWSPEFPNLYHLETAVLVDGDKIDVEINKIGVRRFQIDAGGFRVNGEKIFPRGTNRHQEYPHIGYALSDKAQHRDAKLVKEAGFDLVRLSHYPQSPAFLDACDELGILVMNPIPGWQYYRDGQFAELALRDAREMIRRDRNHPSVALWETSLNETYAVPETFTKALHDIVHEEMPDDHVYSCGCKDLYYDVFIPARQHTDGPVFWDDWKNGDKAIFTAEYGDFEYLFHDYTRSNFEQTKARRKKLEDSSRQPLDAGEERLLRQAFNFQEGHNQNHVCGSMVGDANWVFADYNRGVANDRCESGVVDLFRLPKFAYYFYRSQRPANYVAEGFNAGPMVFIASYWDENSSNVVKVFGNCEEVELSLNGSVVEKRRPDADENSMFLNHPPFTFENVERVPGELKAIGYIGGVAVAEHVVRTPESPRSIEVRLDLGGKSLSADGADAVFARAVILDQHGTVVSSAANAVSFEIEGDARLIGENPVAAKAGIASILVQGGLTPGEIQVVASAEGLTPGRGKIVSATNQLQTPF